MADIAVALQNVSKRFPGPAGETVTAVNDVSLHIQDGEFFALLGPSGCGKTTSLRMIAGLETPDAGEISVLGWRVPEDSKQARAAMGVVPQLDNLDVELTARQVLEVFARLYRVPHAERAASVARVLEIVRSGQLGTLQHMEAGFKVAIKDKTDLRHRYETAGGATMDLGCYPLHWMRQVAGAEPRVLTAHADQGARHVDVTMRADLAFPGGLTGHMVTSMADHEPFSTYLRIEAANGTLFVTNPLAPHNGHELELTLDGKTTREKVEGLSTYRHQLVEFVSAVQTGKQLPTMGEDSIANMKLIDSVYRAAGMPVRGTLL